MWRLILKYKRSFLVVFVGKKRKYRTSIAKSSTYEWRKIDYPNNIFPPRKHFVKSIEEKGVIEITFLNKSRVLSHPINWRPLELRKGIRLWLLNLHYHEFLEGLPPEITKSLILDWIENVKPYEKDYWLDTWNSYSLSIRVVKWIQILNASQISFKDEELLKSNLLKQDALVVCEYSSELILITSK